jgi:tripartite-type tricarboxylate transporter receptor subunit TctC
MRRRHLLFGAAALGVARRAHAGLALTLLIGARPDSRVDRIVRSLVPFFARHLPYTDIALCNIPGGAGLEAMDALAEAAPDGTTLGWIATPSLAARMIDRGGDQLMQRLLMLGAVQKEPIAIVSPAATPLASVQDIVSRAAEDADAVPLGTPPPGSPPHLAALRLQAIAGTRLNIVTFPSAAAARQAAVGGNVAAAALGLSDVIGDLREKRLVGLGIATKNRKEQFPDMPPLADSGLDLSAFICRGLAAPVGLPPEIAERIRLALQALVADPEYADQADENGFLARWIDGPSWTALAEQEHGALQRLWTTEPWLSEGSG